MFRWRYPRPHGAHVFGDAANGSRFLVIFGWRKLMLHGDEGELGRNTIFVGCLIWLVDVFGDVTNGLNGYRLSLDGES